MFKKLMGAFTALILIGVLITGLLSMEIAKGYYFKSVEDKLFSNAKLLQRELVERLLQDVPPDYEKFCREYSGIAGERITVIAANGMVIGDSDMAADGMPNHGLRPEVQQALEKGFGKSMRGSGSLGNEMLYIALPLNVHNTVNGVVRVALPLDDIFYIQKKIWHYIFLAIFAGISAAWVLGYRYLSSVTKPVKEITEMADTIAGGKLDGRVQVKTDDEIGRLGSAFNHMAEKLNNTINELIDDKSKMEAILTSSRNGVIAVDGSGKAMIINPVAERLLGVREKNFTGKHLSEIVKNEEILEILNRILASHGEGPTETEILLPKGRVVRAFSGPIKLKARYNKNIGTLVILRDISHIRKLEKIRTDFATNVSHELKTPLTSIRGFIETLKGGAIEDRESRYRFLDIIDIEAERLERLIEDILLLSEIESKPVSSSACEIRVDKVINDEILSMFDKQAAQKKIRLTTWFCDPLPPLIMDMDRFKQMMINLVDNAIKFSSQNDEVTVSVCSTQQSMVIKVKDTGIGIPREHQDRIFERFYRADRGRSRKVGGTGLGLAIVKHIVLSAGGTIKVDSRPGEGTEFTIEMPLESENLVDGE